MSRWLGKQRSFESPGGAGNGAGYARRLSEDEGKGHRRSLSQPASGAGERQKSRDPLKRFVQAKDAIRRAFQHLEARLKESQTFMRAARDPQGGECEGVAELVKRTSRIQEMLNRNHMKVAFFGRTSNGKSSVINALLHSRVMPVGIGHTTNCFCSVVGAEGSEGYLLTGDSQEKCSTKNLQQLAHALSSKHLDPSALVQIFWPKTKCALLREDVEFIDSPGIDMDANNDNWIEKHCQDADVFVMVSNAESTIMNVEKKFFHQVSECLSKPNVFILNNRWDASDAADIPEEDDGEEGEGGREGVDGAGPQLMERVMQQHLEKGITFLAKELQATDEQTARHRVFFVSAKEVFCYRLRQLQGSADPGQGLAVGHTARLQNFEQFERQFKECLSSSAIQTKFGQHYKQGLSVVSDLVKLLAQEDTHLQAEREQVSEKLSSNQSRAYHLAQQGPSLVANGDQLVVKMLEQLKVTSSGVIQGILAQLSSQVDDYQQPFDPRDLGLYCEGLFTPIDEMLSSELKRMNALSPMYEEVQKTLIDTHQALLQLPSSEMDMLSMVPAPSVTYVLQCSDDFHEDLRCSFSLGLKVLLAVAKSKLWHISVVMVPAALVVATFVKPLNQLPWFLRVCVLTPSLLVLAPSLLVLGPVVYGKWSRASKEAVFKEKFVQHMKEKVQLQVKATNNSHIAQLQANLGVLNERLRHQLESCQREADSNVVELTKQRDSLSALQSRLKVLRNTVQLSCTNLETFREDFLDQ